MNMKSSAGKIQLATFNDLFQSSGEPAVNSEQVREIALSELHFFQGHPFRVQDDEAMREMADSIAQYGVLVPAIVRPRKGGGYEIIAGHRRKRGSELAGKDTMPVLVRDLDDDEGIIVMVDSNLQREKLLPSEKAFAYKMKLDALKHQGRRLDLTLAPAVPKLSARDRIAQDAGEKSGMAVTRYISLTKLIRPLLDMVDDEKIAVSSAADYISVLSEDEQRTLLEVMERLHVTPSQTQLAKIRQYSKEGTLSGPVIDAVLSAEQPVPVRVVLKSERLKQYFPATYSVQQMEDVIVSLLENWKVKQEEQ